MRTETISGLKVTYPDYMVWDGDNNYVMLKVPTGRQAHLAVTIGTRTLDYVSEGDTVVIDISLLLRRYAAYGAVSLGVYIATVTPAYSTIRTYTIYVCRGWTLADRYHFSGRKIVLPYGSTAVDIPCAAACTITGGTATISVAQAMIESYGITTSGVVNVHYSSVQLQGYSNDPISDDDVTYEVEIKGCHPVNGAIVQWYDCDGCKRYLVGKVLERGSKADTAQYRDALFGKDAGTIRNIVGRVVSSIERTISIGVAQVSEAMHLEEMLYSSEVLLINPVDQTQTPIIPDFSEIEVNMREIQDITLKFKVQQ